MAHEGSHVTRDAPVGELQHTRASHHQTKETHKVTLVAELLAWVIE